MRALALVLAIAQCGEAPEPQPDRRGFGAWKPGLVLSGGLVEASVAVPGAEPGDDCIAGVSHPAPVTGFFVQCIVDKDSCKIGIRNTQPTGYTFGEAVFYCRALKR